MSLKGRLKKKMAGALAFLTLVGAVPVGGITAYAYDPELGMTNLGSPASENINQTWKYSNDFSNAYSGSESWRFNLRGRKAGQGEVYTEAGPDQNMKFTYNDYGFPSYVFMAKDADNSLTPDILHNTEPGGTYNPEQELTFGGKGYYSAKHGQRDQEGNPNTGGTAQYNGYTELIKFGPAGDQIDVEMKITATPSPDKKYMYIDYYLAHVGGTRTMPPAGLNFWLGSAYDLQINNNLTKDMYKTGRGFYMRQTAVPEVIVDVITDDVNLGITEPTTTKWAGSYTNRCKSMFTESTAEEALSSDSSISYSWAFKIRPNEVIHRRVAFAMKEAAYYVSTVNGNDSPGRSGTFLEPLATIGEAIKRCNGKNAYIFIQDYAPISSPIDFNVITDAGTKITIASTDMTINKEPTLGATIDLERAAGYTGPLFTNDQNFSLTFTDINIKGNKAAVPASDPLITASKGKLELNNLLTLTDNGGSAVKVTGSAGLTINGGSKQVLIEGNTPAPGSGAVDFDGSGKFSVQNKITIVDNVNTSGARANVYLANNRYISIDEGISGSQIGISAAAVPAPGGAGIKVVDNTSSIITDPVTAYLPNFSADAGSGSGIYLTASTSDDLVLKSDGLELSQLYVDENNLSITHLIDTSVYPYTASKMVSAGAAIDELVIPITGYTYTGAQIAPASGHNLAVQYVSPDRKLQGTMPNQAVVVTYQYKRMSSAISFETYGGNPQPAPITGDTGQPVNGTMPAVARTGYTFAGWFDNAGYTGSEATALPANFGPNNITYHAKWVPNTSEFFDYTVRYVNSSDTLTFNSATTAGLYYVGYPLNAEYKTVPGYNLLSTGVAPATYPNEVNVPVSTGSFNSGTHDFSGHMPNQAAVVTYQYSVDPSSTFPLTVKHVSDTGVELDSTTVWKHPEDPISTAPQSFYGFTFKDEADIAEGRLGSVTSDTIIMGIEDTFNGVFGPGKVLNTQMPNQPVTIVYVYESDGTGFNFTVEHKYDGLGASDLSSGADLKERASTLTPAGTTVTAGPENIYGYFFTNFASADPASYDSEFDPVTMEFSTAMPSDALQVTYQYGADPAFWKQITYKSGPNGTINNDGLSNVSGSSGGPYTTSVLYHDGSAAGAANAYTWQQIQEKGLVPNTAADPYYMFDQWYIDANHNNQLDPGEALSEAQQFGGPAELTAHFVEDPDKWIDIHFAAGANGRISGSTTCHLPYDKTWGDVANWVTTMPVPEAVINYLPDGWYGNGQRVQGTTPLTDGQTYIHQFKKDPLIWGLPVNTPDADGRLGVDGSGQIIVHEVSPDYQYVIVDEDGNVAAVKNGDNSGSLTFPDLYPGHEYQVYEVGMGETVNPGDPVSGIGDKSAPQNVLIPVLEDNYRITPDPYEDGKVTIIVNPADPDSKYAIIDKDGNVVYVPDSDGDGWVDPKGSNPSVVEFPGLNPNEEYTVVAVPKDSTGVTPSEREDKGSTVIADPGVELNIPTYTVETIRGSIAQAGGATVNAQRCETVKEGDLVSLNATATDNAGNAFAYWQVLIGNIDGIHGKIVEREVDFVMPKTNVVLAAYYERPVSTPSNALVEDEVRGGSAGEMALNPEHTQTLEHDLTTDHDRDLMEENGAEVVYKIVFDKNKIKSGEKEAIISEPAYDTGVDKELAFTSPWALNIRLERYVDGRKVNIATSSNAISEFEVVVQLEDEHIDMLDYQLFELSEDVFGNKVAALVTLKGPSENRRPEDNEGDSKPGGLFRFKGKVGARYVMVYSKAFWVKFINEHKGREFPPDPLLNVSPGHKYKVRRRYPINGADYLTDFDKIWTNPLDTYKDADGIQHTYEGWSTKKLPEAYKAYNPDAGVGKPLVLYAYYKNNIKEITDERSALDDYIEELLKVADEHFLTAEEKQEILDEVREAKELQEKTGPRASLDELRSKTQELKAVVEHYEPILVERKEEYDNQHTGGGNSASGGGGSGSGGGSGKGTSAKPYIPAAAKTYTVGVNGNWQQLGNDPSRWSFVLNGGTPLRGMWAWLNYQDGNVNSTGWYHFNASGEMDSGWFRDEQLNWYYCDTVHDGSFGKMKTGWYYDQDDKRWYYLDGESGMMATGWREIGGKWYYFAPTAAQETYEQDPVTRKWSFKQVSTRPLGSMYAGEATPDGYQVGADGAWIR